MDHLTPDDRIQLKNAVPTQHILLLLLLSGMSQEPMACDDCTAYLHSILMARALRHDGRN
jgi:hypothetical protein